MVCSAISRQVVHLPPVTKVTPVSGLVEIRWSREAGAWVEEEEHEVDADADES